MALVALAAAPSAWAQTTWHVDDNAPNDPAPGDPTVSDPLEDGSADHPFDAIQEGIDAATDGDTVLVADGTYTGVGNKNLDHAGKAITVRSENGPDVCVIDCENDGRGFYFHSVERMDSIVEGLTITNGTAARGGAVYCISSSPTLTDCTISGNSASNNGGGVYCYMYSNPTLTDCTISGNSADSIGGAIYCNDSCPMLTNCTISGNLANSAGGVGCHSSSPVMTNCILWADTPGEIYVHVSNPVITHCDIQGGWFGEGNVDVDPLFAFPDDCHLMPGSPCIDAGTNDPPGGLPVDDPDGNTRPLDGDGDTVAIADMGVYEFNPAFPSIALSPARFQFLAPVSGDDPPDQMLSVRNSGGGTLGWEINGQAEWLAAWPTTGESSGEVNQVTLSVDVSGLSHGVYTAVLEVVDPQATNSPREVFFTLYVAGTLNVPSEYPTIQAAIDAAAYGDVVKIADGTYAGIGNKHLDFCGKAITVRSENGPETCVIDCENDGRGFYFHSDETAESVVDGLTIRHGNADVGGGIYCAASSPTVLNCIFSENFATASSEGASGGAMCNCSASPTLTNCLFWANATAADAGAMSNLDSAPTLTDCLFIANVAPRDGGAMFNYVSSPALISCTFDGNSASETGGAVRNQFSSAIFASCIFSANSAEYGGGMYNWFGGSPVLVDCVFSDNWADVGGGMRNSYSTATVINSVFRGNSATGTGGAICNHESSLTACNCTFIGNSADEGGGVYDNSSDSTLTNCTLSGNSAVDGGGGIWYRNYFPGSDPTTLANCILWADTPQEIYGYSEGPVVTYCDVDGGWEGEGNIDADPLFVDPENGDYHLLPGSPCIDAGCNCAVSEDSADLDGDGVLSEYLPFDLDGEGRFFDDPDTPDSGSGVPPIVDMGAYEFGGSDSPPCHGDLDGDHDVDIADLAELLGHYGTTSGANGADGDMDCDGDIDIGDLAELLGAYGDVCE